MKLVHITVTGLVQGIGFRPFVAEQAEELNLNGQVKNVGGIVIIDASGDEKALNEFVQRLSSRCPKGGRVDRVEVEERFVASEFQEFSIVTSSDGEEELTFLPADLATCEDCERELKDSSNRRFHHPFISCVSCGPRFTIMNRLPYDRETITMADFPMCPDCSKEYKEKGNRRRHAQTIACKDCGPTIRLLVSPNKEELYLSQEEMVDAAAKLLLEGKIGAIKDIGGFHFAFQADLEEPAERLRRFKNREKKPFAVMFPSIETVREYCEVSEKEEELLLSPARPIVLLKKKKDFAPSVCGDSDRIGAMLPCNPLQILLGDVVGPLVMTSGNRGGEPIITDEEELKEFLAPEGIDFILAHDRKILTPVEDSILQVIKLSDGEHVQMLRRARGYVPEPIRMNRSLEEPCFAAGGDLKSVFAIGKKDAAYLSSHFGDLEEYRCQKKRQESILHMERLLSIEPEDSIGDLHPLYVSSQNVNRRIQHHHAHILSVIAEHGLGEEKVLGLAFDGTGYGTDGSIWGGEFLLCKANTFERVAHLSPVSLMGSDEGAKNGKMSLLAYLEEARERRYLPEQVVHSYIEEINAEEASSLLQKMKNSGVGLVKSSSMGRLFDAASALLSVCAYNSYEGECAIRLEVEAHKALMDGLTFPREEILEMATTCIRETEGHLELDGVRLMAELLKRRNAGEDRAGLALYFHQVLVMASCEMVNRLCRDRHFAIALSGGTFCNRILLTGIYNELTTEGYQVYINEKVPCGDGGLALGQMYAGTY